MSANPFQKLAKKFEKLFIPGNDNESDDSSRVHSAISNMRLSADHQKELEKAIQEQLRRQREAEAEKRRQELLEATTASTPWKPKARPGDELYPSLRSSKSAKQDKAASAPPTKSGKAPPPSPRKADSSDSSGLTPPAIDVDDDAGANSVRASSLRLLLEDLAKDAEPTVKDAKKDKSLNSLSPKELIEALRNDDRGWRRLIRENTVMAMAAAMPKESDRKKAAENMKGSHRTKIRFNEKLEAILVPVGQPYKAKEAAKKETGVLDLERRKK